MTISSCWGCIVHNPVQSPCADRAPVVPSVLLRRLRLPLSLARRFCRCGRLLDSFGHHRASCARAGVLGRRGYASRVRQRGCVARQVHASTNVLVRDLDLGAPEATVARRLEVVAEGLPLFGGASWPSTQRWCQLCIATGVPAQVPHTGTEWRWKWQDVARNGLTRS